MVASEYRDAKHSVKAIIVAGTETHVQHRTQKLRVS